MAHLLRGKQAGVQKDLSFGVSPELFTPDDFARYGVNSKISAIAFDPIHSLLALGTEDSQYGSGLVYVYGQQRVCATFSHPRRASIRQLQFCADKLISLDSKNNICVFSLETGTIVANYAPPGQVTAILTDPSLDYCFTGLQNGEIVSYDLDRQAVTGFRIPNLWREANPRARLLPVVAMQFHPRDIGTLLIAYPEGAVLFSFHQNQSIKFFQYEVPRGAPGGEPDLAAPHEVRRPRLSHAIWHPTGTFILTAHEDSSLVFWDPRDGRIIEARTLHSTSIHLPGGAASATESTRHTRSMKQPYFGIAWCSKPNADDTGLLIAGGTSTSNPTPGLTFLELGQTPNYQTSSWDVLAKCFRVPKRTQVLPTPPNAEIVKFCLIPRSSPHYAGSHDPLAVIALLSSGEMVTLSFPSGHPISPTNQLHVSLSFVHPFITRIALACVDRPRWLGTREVRQQGPSFLLGGVEEKRRPKRYENRNIVQTAHADGTVRVWDAGHGDEIENSGALQADLPRALGRFEKIDVARISMSGAAGEMSVGLASGEVIVFRLDKNRQFGRQPPPPTTNAPPGTLTDILERVDPTLKEGLLPLTLLNEQQGPVAALNHSDIGFVAIGFQDSIVVIDLRGPAIVYKQSLGELTSRNKRGSLRSNNNRLPTQGESPTTIEFGIMTLEGDDYSSISLFVGTSHGRVATFKILPASNGTYSVAFAGLTSLDGSVVSISPINIDNGCPAHASQSAMGNLKSGARINGSLVVSTASEVHIFKPASARGAHKNFDRLQCQAASVVRLEDRGFALVGLFDDGYARAYSLPALKEVGQARLDNVLDATRYRDATITPTGDILAWTGPSEIALLHIWGTGQPLPPTSRDRLFNPQATVPPRPTISNLQWISGTQHVTPADMDALIGGPNRPPSKRMLAEMHEAQNAQRVAQSSTPRASTSTSTTTTQNQQQQNQEGYWSYMQRQVQERTEQLGLTSDSMDRLEQNSSSWATDVNKYVKKQKRNMVLGAVGSKLGL